MNNILICGLGALGLTYAVKLKENSNLRILVDENRLVKFKANKPVFNGIEQEFDYILPTENFVTDLIIIATKYQGLNDAINLIKNFVTKNTMIISLINGISSETMIKLLYPQAKVLKSYFIGHSAVREGNSVSQDGIGEIVIEHNEKLEQIFKQTKINFTVATDINYSMWLKFIFNIFSNQTSAILDMNFGELKRNKNFLEFAQKIILEILPIAERMGVQNLENITNDAIDALNKMCDSGKTSMLQDITAKRATEVEMFAGEIIRLGEQFNIPTPYNRVLYDLIKIKEENNEHSIYTC